MSRNIMAGILSRPHRFVNRVLLMVEFKGEPSGDVYDLTALLGEMHARAPYGADIGVTLRTERNYGDDAKTEPFRTHITFNGSAGEWCSGATHIEDVLNYGLADDDRVTAARRKVARLEKQLNDAKYQVMQDKLRQVASIRHMHPIAKFNMDEAPISLPQPPQQ